MNEELEKIVLTEVYKSLEIYPDVVGRLELDCNGLFAYPNGKKVQIVANVLEDPEVHPSTAHVHIIVRPNQDDFSGSLDACVVGIHEDKSIALCEAAKAWMHSAAGPVFSLFHARPVIEATHFDGTEPWGVEGAHGFVGSTISRNTETKLGKDNKPTEFTLVESPLFQYVAELSPPGTVHLAKSILSFHSGKWERTIEIDGHRAIYVDRNWKWDHPPFEWMITTRFAAFHYADRPEKTVQRELLDSVIRDFVSTYAEDNQADVRQRMIDKGHPELVVDRVNHFLPLAFGRVMLIDRMPVTATPSYHRVLSGGGLMRDIPLMSEPAFARATALAPEFLESRFFESVKSLALHSGEVDAINNLLHSGGKLENAVLIPCLVPDLGATQDDVDAASSNLRHQRFQRNVAPKKPWWKIW